MFAVVLDRLLGALFPKYQYIQYYDTYYDLIYKRQMTKAEWKLYYHLTRKRAKAMRLDKQEYEAWVARNL